MQRENKSRSWLIVTAVLAGALITGCSRKDSDPARIEAPAVVAERVENVFTAADKNVFTSADTMLRDQAQIAAAALKKGEDDRAFAALEVLKMNSNLSFEQTMAVRNAMQSLQVKIAEGVMRGDPAALKAAEAIRRIQR